MYWLVKQALLAAGIDVSAEGFNWGDVIRKHFGVDPMAMKAEVEARGDQLIEHARHLNERLLRIEDALEILLRKVDENGYADRIDRRLPGNVIATTEGRANNPD